MFVCAINRMIANVVADVRDVRNFGLTLGIYPFGSIFFETPLIFLFLLCIFSLLFSNETTDKYTCFGHISYAFWWEYWIFDCILCSGKKSCGFKFMSLPWNRFQLKTSPSIFICTRDFLIARLWFENDTQYFFNGDPKELNRTQSLNSMNIPNLINKIF